jgi:hypothetical protein
MIRLLAYLTSLLIFVGCASIERTHESGYSNSSAKRKTDKSMLSESQPNTDQKIQLKQLENGISGKRELEQYSKALPWFSSAEEKIEFLRIHSYEQRQEWLISRDFPSRSKRVISEMQDVVDSQDIAMGMPEVLVKKSWGDPTEVDVSGVPEFRNFRWKYQKFVSTPDGYKSEKKTVYFEGGKVVGWEVE